MKARKCHPGASWLTCTPPSSPSLSVCPSLPGPHPRHPTHAQLAHLGSGAPPASTHAAATTGRAVAPRMGPATAPQVGPDSSARSVSPASQPPSHLESHAAACWLPWASSGHAVEGGSRQAPGLGAIHPHHPPLGLKSLAGLRGLRRPKSWKARAIGYPSNHQDQTLLGQGAQRGEEQPVVAQQRDISLASGSKVPLSKELPASSA